MDNGAVAWGVALALPLAFDAHLVHSGRTSLTWYVEWIGTGTCAAVQVASFAVQPRPF